MVNYYQFFLHRLFEQNGKKMLEILHVQHEIADGHNFTHSSLQMPSQTWGDMCPADLALLGNFKVKEKYKRPS